MGWGWPRAIVTLKEKMRLMGEYPPEHFLEFSGKPIRRKSSPLIGLISFRMTAIFGQHGSHHIPKRVSSNICTPPSHVSCLATLQDDAP